jgi:DNA-binding transcriptional LysR family regulator
MDRLEAMAILVEAVDVGSLSAASRKMNVPLPTVSRKIADLESHLGARLLTRSTRKLTLTDAGATYVAVAKRILEQVADAERAAAGEYRAPRGDLGVTAPIVFGRLHLLPLVTDFLTRYPEIDIRLVLSDRNTDLIDEHMDIAIRIGALPDSSMIATRIGAVRHVICASPSFLASYGVPETPAALATFPCISHDFLTVPSAAWAFREPGAKVDMMAPVRVRLAVTTAEAAIDAAVAGIGVTRLISHQVADAVARGALRIILARYECEPIPVSILYAGQGILPLKVRAFRDFATPRLRAALGSAKPDPPGDDFGLAPAPRRR